MNLHEPATPTNGSEQDKHAEQLANNHSGKKGKSKKAADRIRQFFNQIIRDAKNEIPEGGFSKELQSPKYENLKDQTYRTQKGRHTLLHMVVDELIKDLENDPNEDVGNESSDENDNGLQKHTGLLELMAALVNNLDTSWMLVFVDDNESTPLHRAIEGGYDEMVSMLYKAASSLNKNSPLPKALDVKSKKSSRNCIHEAMESDLKTDTIIKLVESAGQDTLCAQDQRELTPLHLAVDYTKCEDKERLIIVKALIKHADKALDIVATLNSVEFSVYAYHNHTREICQQTYNKKREHLEKKRTERRKSNYSSTQSDVEPKKLSAKEERDSEKETRKSDRKENKVDKDTGTEGEKSKLKHVEFYKQAQHQNSFKLSEGLQLGSPAINGLRTPPRTPTHEKSAADAELTNTKVANHGSLSNVRALEEEELRNPKGWESDANAVRDYIKLHYLRTREPEKAASWLYGVNTDDIQTSFDYCEVDGDNPEITATDFINTFKHFNLDKVLQFVRFRSVKVRGKDSDAARFSKDNVLEPGDDDPGRTDMRFFFDWLKHMKKVERILKVTVDDSRTDPHSDHTIEACLKPFQVEVLDWRKVDLCPVTICHVGDSLREITLQWSGNNSVLRGWSEPEGLTLCERLRKIRLNFDKRLDVLEGSTRVSKNIAEFRSRLESNKKKALNSQQKRFDSHQEGLESHQEDLDDRILVVDDHNPDDDWQMPISKQLLTSMAERDQKGQANVHKWLECISAFADKIRNVDIAFKEESERCKNTSIPRSLWREIVVAVIDDGVDISRKDLRAHIKSGTTFHSGQHYRFSSSGHGTVMASMLTWVCPMVKIQVIKLQTFLGPGKDSLGIDAMSAAKAIEAAVARKVDIISMSWSIPKPADPSREKTMLDNALKSAIDKGILMFCSSGDRGDLESPETYPGAFNRNKIFRIAGATSTGRGREGTPKAESFDFLLPGEDVIERRPKGVPKLQSYSGSSVATALASGLAALVFHIIRLGALSHELKELRTQEVSASVFKDMSSSKHAVDYMRAAFESFGVNKENHKFVEVWSLLDKDPNINNSWGKLNPDDRLEAMKYFANILISHSRSYQMPNFSRVALQN